MKAPLPTSFADADGQTVYIYRVALGSANGVSSTRSSAIAPLTFREGEIRQIQFVEDDTVMILWSNGSMSSFLAIGPSVAKHEQKEHHVLSAFPTGRSPNQILSLRTTTATAARHHRSLSRKRHR